MSHLRIALVLAMSASPAFAEDDDPPPLARLGDYHIEENGVYWRPQQRLLCFT